jgi:hypothetical protein
MKPIFMGSATFAPINLDLSELGEHFDHCRQAGGRFFRLRCGVETLKYFVAGRLVTSSLVVLTLIGLGTLAL